MVATVITVILLAAIHPLSAHIVAQRHIRRRTISFCAGIALAYVFLHILPELASLQARLLDVFTKQRSIVWFEEHVYSMALLGLLTFQIVDSLGRTAKTVVQRSFSFKGEMLFFAGYCALIGYLVTSNTELNRPIILITIALGAHFFGTDMDLTERYKEAFVKRGSYVLSGATVGGMILALVCQFHLVIIAACFSFLAGAILVNTLRTELPEPNHTRFLYVLLGAALYAALITIIIYYNRLP